MKIINPSIREAVVTDIPAIIELMREFAGFEKLLESLEVTAEDLQKVLFGKNAFVKCLVASEEEKPIAYAIFYPAFSSFRGQKSVYLEDIFISAKYRKYGIGEKMLKEVARVGKEFGAKRMDFQVLEWNTPAINFYKKYDAVMDEVERHFRFTDEAFEKLSE